MASTPANTMNAPQERRSLGGWLIRKIFLSPFKWMWWFASRVEKRIGILFTLLSGALLSVVGWWLISSFIGFPIGLPMVLFGVMLVLRALY